MSYYKSGIIQSIVFVTHDYSITKLPKEMKEFLEGNTLNTGELEDNEALELMRKRIGNIKILSDETILKLFKMAGRNPRRFLAYAEDVCRYAVEVGDKKVNDFHISEVIGKKGKKEEKT